MKKALPCEMVRRDIEELILERKLTVDTLSRITKINQQWFIDFISQKKNIKNISKYDIRFLTDLTSILKMGIDFDCDSRLKSIIETLIIKWTQKHCRYVRVQMKMLCVDFYQVLISSLQRKNMN